MGSRKKNWIETLVPVTKIIGTLLFSLWAVMLHDPADLAVLNLAELLLLAAASRLYSNKGAVVSLAVFAGFLGLVQFLGGGTVYSAFVTGLRMLAMTLVFILLLTTTRLQDLTAALVTQLKIPYEYAFMFTAALRFVPDFISESKAVQEAQACRGMSRKGNPFRRAAQYIRVVQPLVLKSLSRSETMALSLELRGFGGKQRSFLSAVSPHAADYGAVILMLAVTAALLCYIW